MCIFANRIQLRSIYAIPSTLQIRRCKDNNYFKAGTYKVKDVEKQFGFYLSRSGDKVLGVSVVMTFTRMDGSEVEEILATHRFFRSIATTVGDVTTFTPYIGGKQETVDLLKQVFRGTPDEMIHKASTLGLIGRTIRITWHEIKNDDYSGTDRWLEVE